MKTKGDIPHWDAFKKASIEGDEQQIALEFCDFEDNPRLNPEGVKSKDQDKKREEVMLHRLDSISSRIPIYTRSTSCY